MGKAQAAMEYIMIAALISIVVIPTTLIFYNYAIESAEDIDQAQIDRFAREVITAAETVYYLGAPSRIILEERLPESVESIRVTKDPASGNYLLIIDARTKGGVTNFAYLTEANIAGAFEEGGTTAGTKRVRIEAAPLIGTDTLVTISTGGDPACSDGTSHNACSAAQPMYCFNTVLLDNCIECGCPTIISELQCNADGTCLVPKITGITPNSGPARGGTTVTITGSGFIATPVVEFGGFFGTVTFVNRNELRVTTPVGSGTVDVVVTNADGGSSTLSDGFTYIPPPTISSLTPSEGTVDGGTIVTITGSRFVATPFVLFGGVDSASVTFVNSTELTATTPSHAAGLFNVNVINPDRSSYTLTDSFTYKERCNDNVDNDGDGFVDLNDVGCADANDNDERNQCSDTVDNDGDGFVDLNDVGCADANDNDERNPIVSGVNPPSGPVTGGTSITISGADFIEPVTVEVGGVYASNVVFVSNSEVSALTPAGIAGAADVRITNPDSQAGTLTSGFTYIPPPSITSLSPSTGPTKGGTSVTITGSNFIATPVVEFGGVAAASVTFVSSTELTATTPFHMAGAVDVVVENPDGQSGLLPEGFSYTASNPRIDSVSPSSGPVDGGTRITIYGADFFNGPGFSVTVGGNAASDIFVFNSGGILATTPAGTAGTADVVVTNPDGQSSDATTPASNDFTYYLVSRVFATSQRYTGNLGGLLGADAKCQARADAAELGGNWKAWLSTSTVNAKDRIPDAYYVRVRDSITRYSPTVAEGKADLTDGTLDNAIDRNEHGQRIGSYYYVWTGTKADGTFDTVYKDCNGWTSSSGAYYARVGHLLYKSSEYWTYYYSVGYCPNSARLYCFETP